MICESGWVVTTGGVYVWKDGREVPDTMSVSMKHEKDLLFTWDSGFGNRRFGDTEDVLGTDGTISRDDNGIRYRILLRKEDGEWRVDDIYIRPVVKEDEPTEKSIEPIPEDF